jgi:hypothetical protein
MIKKFVFWLFLGAPALLFSQGYQVGDHELMFMPTAYTMDKGSSYFSDYELFFLNFVYAPTATTHLGVFTLFPITSDFLETATIGLKQNYARMNNFAGAVWATYTPKSSWIVLGNVFSIGKVSNSLHLGIGGVSDMDATDSDWELIYMVGYRHDFSKKFSLLVEYTNSETSVEEDFNGLISIGVRFRSENVAWEIGGFRPLEDTGDLFLLPLLKGTFMF